MNQEERICQRLVDDTALEEGLSSLESSSEWSPCVVSKLESFIRTETDLSLFRINPIRYAQSHSLHESESIDLFLQATRAGLFEMEWNIVCGSCSNAFKSFRNLEKIDPHFQCNLCDMENSVSLDDLIHVMFTISPKITDIPLHHPDQLTLEQLIFDFEHSQDSKAQYDGLTVSELLRQLAQVLQYLEPGEEISLDIDLTKGSLVVRDTALPASVVFFVGFDESPEERRFHLTLDETGFSHPNLGLTELTLETPVGTHVFPEGAPSWPGKGESLLHEHLGQESPVLGDQLSTFLFRGIAENRISTVPLRKASSEHRDLSPSVPG